MLYIEKGHSVNRVLGLIGLSRSSFYYRPSRGASGRKASGRTWSAEHGWVDDRQVISQITDLLAHPFVDYGYRKVWHYLRQRGYRINHKKIARLMRENHLMLPRRRANEGKRYVLDTVPRITGPGSYLEMDIKVIYIRGANRNAYQLSIIDLFDRRCRGFRIGYSMRKAQVICLIKEVLAKSGIGANFSIRTDNGAQFIAKMLRDFLAEAGILHEFIRPATPQQNGHIEAFHSVMQRAVIERFEFDSLDELISTMTEFIRFYNEERLHSATLFLPPEHFLQAWNMGRIGFRESEKGKMTYFFKGEKAFGAPSSSEAICGSLHNSCNISINLKEDFKPVSSF